MNKVQQTAKAIPGGLLVAGLAVGLTYLVTNPQYLRHNTAAPVVVNPHVARKAAPKPTPAAPVVEPAAPAAAVVTPVQPAAPAARTAVTNDFVHMRAGHSTATPIVQDLQGGTTVTLGDYSDSLWQQASANGISGYVYKSYLRY